MILRQNPHEKTMVVKRVVVVEAFEQVRQLLTVLQYSGWRSRLREAVAVEAVEEMGYAIPVKGVQL